MGDEGWRRSMGRRVFAMPLAACVAIETMSLTLTVLISFASKSAAAPPPRYACPSQVEPLVALMLSNLASYTNRVIARSTPRGNPNRSYVLTAGRPEFEPLPLSPDGAASLGNSSGKPDPNLRQVFITTLERQTLGRPRSRDTEVYLQGFHWLFLTKAGSEWQLALLFSQIGTYPKAPVAANSKGALGESPPRESSQGILGQAIRTWLRDCNAGVVRPIKSNNLLDKTG